MRAVRAVAHEAGGHCIWEAREPRKFFGRNRARHSRVPRGAGYCGGERIRDGFPSADEKAAVSGRLQRRLLLSGQSGTMREEETLRGAKIETNKNSFADCHDLSRCVCRRLCLCVRPRLSPLHRRITDGAAAAVQKLDTGI